MMATTAFSCFLIALASIFLVWIIYHTITLQQRGARRAGLQLQREVMLWVVMLQQHRGMCNALLQGDQNFQPRVLEKQLEIDQRLQAMAQLPPEASAVMPSAPWSALVADWRNLQRGYAQMSQVACFTAHTELITRALLLLGEIGDRAGLTLDQLDDLFGMLRLVTRVLPQLIETTAQTRGLSTAVAVKGHVESVPQIRLTFLLNKIERLTDEAGQILGRLPGGFAAEADAIRQAREAALQTLTQFRIGISNDILGQRVLVKADDVFRQATATIDASYRLYETLLPPLQREVGKAPVRSRALELEQDWGIRPA